MKKIWQSIVSGISNTIEYLDGKKTAIGMAVLLVNAIVKWQVPSYPDEVHEIVRYAGEAIGGIGLFGKAVKTDTGKKVVNAAIDTANKVLGK